MIKLKSIYHRIDLYIYRKYINYKLASLLIGSFIIIFSISACHITTSPDKIYNIRSKIITLAKSLKGIKYVYGGTDIYGFDCSGFVHYVFDSFGVKVPRTAKKQSNAGKKIRLYKAESGDIIVFKLKRRSWHSGIINKKNKKYYFIHAPNKRGVIREEELNGYWLKKTKYIVRVL